MLRSSQSAKVRGARPSRRSTSGLIRWLTALRGILDDQPHGHHNQTNRSQRGGEAST
jgi:hypothetical protein